MYHFGYESDTQRSIQNNFNPKQSTGPLFPAIILEQPTQSLVLNNGQIRSDVRIRLNFFTTQHYNNDGSVNFAQTIEQQNALRVLVFDFLKVNHEVGKLNGYNVQATAYDIEYLEAQTPDRLIQIIVSCVISFNEECPSATFNPAAVLPPYSYPPPDDVDFEKQNVDVTAPMP